MLNHSSSPTRIACALTALFAAVSINLHAAIAPLQAKTGLKPFTYTNSPDALPNYVAGEKWGTQAEPLRTMQLPLSPEESAQHLVLQPGFEAKLWAADPHITKPIALAWDERGRLWIAETVDYPNELKPAGQGRDRIKICEDTDGDGRADKFTVFADKLSIPTSLCFANGGVIVIEGGRTLFLKDTNGDGAADERRVLFSGWGTGDTHATASNLRYGLDNWIWGTVGYSGFDGEVGGKRHKFGMGVFRFKPDGSAMEFVRSSNNNTWGLGLSEEGIIFGSTANNNASWYMAVPNRFYEAVNGWPASRMETIADSQQFYPLTTKVRQVDAHGRYTAGAGHALYTARAFPKEYWNRIAFVAEPTGHLLGFFRLDANGADFKAVNLGSFLASDDEWCAPIVAEVGPDGAVWVIDWYNYIVQHNPTPVGFKTGKGNAYETSLRDKRHGRIYRVTHREGTLTQPPRLNNASPAELVAALTNDNQLWRLHAQRLLVERGRKDVAPALADLVGDTQVDELGLNDGAIHALFALQGLGAVGDEVIGALKHPSAGVRRAAAMVLPRNDTSARALNSARILSDSDAQVRLAAFLALAEMPANGAIGEAVFAALKDSQNAGDRWLRDAVASAAARHADGFFRALFADTATPPEGAEEVIRIVSRHTASRGPLDVVATLALLRNTSATGAAAVLDGFVAGWPADTKPGLDAQASSTLQEVMKALPEPAQERLLTLARRWGRLDLFAEQLARATKNLNAQMADTSADDAVRVAAAKSLVRLEDQPANTRAILDRIDLQSSPALAAGLIAALGESRAADTGRQLLAQWKRFTPAQRRGATAALLRRAEWSGALLDAVEKGDIRRSELGPEQWQQLRLSSDRAVSASARRLGTAIATTSADREGIVKKLLPVAKQTGDIARGKELYAANCGVCHMFYGQGGKVGPDLTGIGARPREDILTDILDPNRSVEANYQLWNVTTKSGETLSGRLDTETQTSIELFDLTGQKQAVLRKDIASLESSTLSIMPSGFEALPAADLAALLEYLAQPAHQ